MPYSFFCFASLNNVKHSQRLEKSFFLFFFKDVFDTLRVHQAMIFSTGGKELWASNIFKVMAVLKVTNYFFFFFFKQWLPILYPLSFIHYQRQ